MLCHPCCDVSPVLLRLCVCCGVGVVCRRHYCCTDVVVVGGVRSRSPSLPRPPAGTRDPEEPVVERNDQPVAVRPRQSHGLSEGPLGFEGLVLWAEVEGSAPE